MAVTVDNSIARVSSDGGTSATTGAFNTSASDGLVICVNCDTQTSGTVATFTISDNQTPDLTYVLVNHRDGADGDGGGVRNLVVVSPGAITGLTITVTTAAAPGNDSPSIKVYKVTGHDTADMVGAIGEGDLTTDPQTTTGITSETAGSAFFANWTDWNTTGTPTSSDLTVDGFTTSGDISGAAGYKAIASAGLSVTGNMNSGGAPSGNWTSFEIRAEAVVGGQPASKRMGGVPFANRSINAGPIMMWCDRQAEWMRDLRTGERLRFAGV